MDKINKLLDKNRRHLMDKNNVVGVGVGFKEKGGVTGEQSIIVLVSKKLPETRLENGHIIPKAIEGVPTDVVEVGNLRLHGEQTQRERPAYPGVSIGNFRITAGTFGALVRDSKSGVLYILSNNHVLANTTDGHDNRSKIGDPIVQPGTYDGGKAPDDNIGYLAKYYPLKKTPAQGGIGRGTNKIASILTKSFSKCLIRPNIPKGNLIDAALAKPVSDDVVSPEIHQIGLVRGIQEAEAGMQLRKSGRTSGLTNGIVRAIHVNVDVNIGFSETAHFTDQIITTPMSEPGDSGSLVLDIWNNAVGLLFAGSEKITICNRIQNVVNILGIELVKG